MVEIDGVVGKEINISIQDNDVSDEFLTRLFTRFGLLCG